MSFLCNLIINFTLTIVGADNDQSAELSLHFWTIITGKTKAVKQELFL